MKERHGPDRRHITIVFITVSLLVLLIWLFPYVYLISSAFKPGAEVISIPPKFLPSVLSVENFAVLFGRLPVLKYLGNSLLCAVVSTIIAVLGGSLCAYAITRLGTKFSTGFVIAVLCLKMIPVSSIAVPIYEIITGFGLYDTQIALIIVYAAINMPFVIWTMLSFYQSIPFSLDEAACIDGASNLATYYKIIMPISAPGIATSAIFMLFLAWNDFLLSLLLTSMNAKTFTVGLSEFLSAYSMDLGPMCAGALLFSFPVMALSVMAQKYIVSGMTSGAVKG
jgi:multiple sugar transport system permease protein